MQLREIIPNYLDTWEEKAENVLSRFKFQHPDEIDMYEICYQFNFRIKPLDPEFFEDDDESEEQFAFSIPKKNKKGLIYLNPDVDPITKRYLLAEEFSHLYLHYQCQVNPNSFTCKVEAQAKKMAVCLLMPRQFLESVYLTASGEPVLISDIADYFLVSEELAHYRLQMIFNHRVDGFAKIKGRLRTIEWLY